MNSSLSPSAQIVQEALSKFDIALHVVELAQSTRTAVDAAQSIGCSVGQIAKSLIFITALSRKPVLIIASGIHRVNEIHVAQFTGEKLVIADPDMVKEITGFVIGGIPPVGNKTALETYVDQDLFQYEFIWAAAGTPFAVFKLAPGDLLRITGGKVISVI